MANDTFGDLRRTKLAKGALAINTLGCQTSVVRQVATCTQMQPLARFAAHIADERL